MNCRKLQEEEILKMMHEVGVRPSLHRIEVLSHVANSGVHPSADSIYTELQRRYPSVSRTTVYNALHTLVSAGLVRELEIDSGNRRYDFASRLPHSHFECSGCGRIFDMAIPSGLEKVADNGFRVSSVDLYFKGLCPTCAEHGEANTARAVQNKQT